MDKKYINRVELHCHTGFSENDGTASVKEIINLAVKEGISSVAFTDHGNVMAYPEIQSYASRHESFKPIYGIEAYVVNDIDMLGDNLEDAKNESLDKDVVVFDIETTGFSPVINEIIEIGVVKIHEGKIIDRFSSFVKPSEPIPKKITELTGISNELVKDAETINIILPRFLEFIEGSILVAHNSSFDISFIKEAAKKSGFQFDYKSIDTWTLSKLLFHELSSYSLDNVAKACSVSLENHHRAVDDAEATAEIYLKMIEMLNADGIKTIGAVLDEVSQDINVINKSKTYHMTVLAKNMAGVQAIYKLVTDSNLKYNRLRPKVRLSELLTVRENLLVGSACSAGFLYDHILMGKSNEVIEKTASMYDFLEIQPVNENMYFIKSEHADNIKCVDDLININMRIIDLGEMLGIPVVATSDVHYLRPENAISRCVLKEYRELKDSSTIDNLHFRTTEEMLNEFKYLSDDKAYEVVIENTNKIAEQIEYIKPLEHKKVDYSHNSDFERLELLCYEALNRVYVEGVPAMAKIRLNDELCNIREHENAYYYLWFYDLIHNNKVNKTQYNLRGCAASCFVCFLLGISHVNPLDEDVPLYNEFFMGINGDKEPDIDINIDADIWGQVLKSVENLTGIKKAYRAGYIKTLDDNAIENKIIDYDSSYFKLSEEIKSIVRNDLTNIVTGIGFRPGGLIMIPDIDESVYSPLVLDEETGETSLMFDYYSLDHIFEKIDILKHDNCTLNAKLYAETGYYPTDQEIKSEQLLSLLTSVDLSDIPGLGNPFMQSLIHDLKPKNFSELVKLEAISHGTNTWLDNGQILFSDGKATLKNMIGTREDVFEMMLSHGIDRATAFEIAEDVRKGKMALGKMKSELREAINNAGLPDWYIWSCEQVRYLFPRTHAAEYVQMELRSLYYKIHYPEIYKKVYSTMDFE